MKKILAILSMILVSASAFAYKAQGWQWYQNMPYINYDKIHNHYQQQAQQTPNIKPSQQLRAIQDDYKEIHDYAIIHPNDVQAAAADLAYKNYFYNQSHAYAISTEKALLLYPKLSANLEYPTARIATQILDHQKIEKQNIALAKVVSHHYGLFWFYKGNDQITQAMAPSLQAFANQYNIKLIGVTMDNTAIPAITDTRLNHGQAQTLGVKAYPGLFLVNLDKNKSYPVAYGFHSINQIKDSILNIVTQYGKVKLDV
jgi:conjugal transfer pilus assembly protein TraF